MTTNAGNATLKIAADIGEAVSALDKVGASAEQMASRASRAAKQAQSDNDRFTASIKKQIDTFGMTQTQLLAYEAGVRGIAAQTLPLIQRLEQMKAASDAFSKAKINADGIADAAANADKGAHATAGMTREVIVLAHEMSQGNFSKFGGSLLVISEYSTKATAALGALASVAAPFAGALAMLAALGIAYKQGAAQADVLNKSLVLTGNFAGVTANQFDIMAKSIAASTSTSVGGARTALQELVSTGNIGPNLLAPAATAVVKMQAQTGKGADEIVADFARMGEGVAKWAQQHNIALNFLTGPQYDYIKRLEEMGDKEGAEAAVLQALNDHLQTSAGYWQRLTTAAGNAWDNMQGLGRGASVADRIQAINAELAAATAQHTQRNGTIPRGLAGGTTPLSAADKGSLQDQGQAAAQEEFIAGERAAAKAADDLAAKQQIAAINARDHWREETKGIDLTQKKLEEYRKTVVEPLKGTPQAIQPKEQATEEAAIRKKYDPVANRSQTGLENAYKTELDTLTTEGIKLAGEIEQWNKYGKAVDGSKLAIVNFDIESGKLKGKNGATLTEPEKQNLRTQAAKDDDLSAQLKASQGRITAAKEIDALIAKIQSEADAHSTNTREVKIAAEMADAEAIAKRNNSVVTDEQRQKIVAATNALLDQTLARKLAAESLANDAEVHKLDEETAALNLSSVERQKATAVLKLFDQAQRDAAENPSKAAEIWAAEAIAAAKLTSAIQRNSDVARSAQTGMAGFFRGYSDDATNAAKVTQTLVSKGVGDLEDGLTGILSGQKINIKSMVDSFIAEFERLVVVKPLLAEIFGTTGGNGTGADGISGILGSAAKAMGLGGLLGGGASSAASTASTTAQTSAQVAATVALSAATTATATSTAATATQTAAVGTATMALGALLSAAYSAASALASVSAAGGAKTLGVTAGAMSFAGAAGAADDTTNWAGNAFEAAEVFSAATGENNVPYDNALYLLHKGEAVVPAAYNPAVGGGTGEESTGSYAVHHHWDFSGAQYHVGQGVTVAQVQQAVVTGQKQTMHAILRSQTVRGSFSQT